MIMDESENQGWIKLHRKSIHSCVWQNAYLWQLWSYCLLKATHKPMWVSVKTGRGFTEIQLQPGQFIFGRFAAAKDLKTTPSSTYKRLQKLKKLGNINTQNMTHFTLITVNNWDLYQNQENESNTQVAPKEHPSSTNKNIKNIKNKKHTVKATTENNTFDIFWQAYPRKVGKGAARKAWQKINPTPDMLTIIIKAIETQKQTPQWQKDGGQYIPYPATWLNQERWEDIVELPAGYDDPTPEQAEKILQKILEGKNG